MCSQSRSAIGFVNLKPIVPGHVLVCPRRVATRLAELAPREAGEVFEAAHALGQCLLHAYSEKRAAGEQPLPGVAQDAPTPTSLTVGIQDGADAGQTISVCCCSHTHTHTHTHSLSLSLSLPHSTARYNTSRYYSENLCTVQYAYILLFTTHVPHSTFAYFVARSHPRSSEKTERL